MDLLHRDWATQVAAFAAVGDMSNRPFDAHVWAWRKARASRLMNKLDDNAFKQGFWDDGVGL